MSIPESVLREAPSIAVAQVTKDDAPRIVVAGMSDLASGRPATARTAYHWFSMTKLVTATAVVQLADRGILDLDSTVGAIYPPFAQLIPTEFSSRVTVRHLLSHSSGLANPIPVSWVHAADEPGPDPERFVAELLRRHRRLRFAPGARASYSNLGYLVLGQAIVRTARISFEEYVRRNILEPLSMSRTGFSVLSKEEADDATGYHARLSWSRPFLRFLVPSNVRGPVDGRFVSFRPFAVHGAAYGGLVGSVEDAARFLQTHLRDGEIGGSRILSERATREMRVVSTMGRRFDLGLGWFRPARSRHDVPAFVEHIGGGLAYFADMRAYPAEGSGVVVMGNSTRFDYESVIRGTREP